jgi:putative redox protein
MEYTVEAVHQGEMRFENRARAHVVATDYPLQAGDEGVGQRPLELLLSSLGSCAGGALIALLRKGGHAFTGLSVRATGQRRAEHPTLFTEISLEFIVRGQVEPAAVERALQVSESTICPVWAMLKPGTKLSYTFRVEP